MRSCSLMSTSIRASGCCGTCEPECVTVNTRSRIADIYMHRDALFQGSQFSHALSIPRFRCPNEPMPLPRLILTRCEWSTRMPTRADARASTSTVFAAFPDDLQADELMPSCITLKLSGSPAPRAPGEFQSVSSSQGSPDPMRVENRNSNPSRGAPHSPRTVCLPRAPPARVDDLWPFFPSGRAQIGWFTFSTRTG